MEQLKLWVLQGSWASAASLCGRSWTCWWGCTCPRACFCFCFWWQSSEQAAQSSLIHSAGGRGKLRGLPAEMSPSLCSPESESIFLEAAEAPTPLCFSSSSGTVDLWSQRGKAGWKMKAGVVVLLISAWLCSRERNPPDPSPLYFSFSSTLLCVMLPPSLPRCRPAPLCVPPLSPSSLYAASAASSSSSPSFLW